MNRRDLFKRSALLSAWAALPPWSTTETHWQHQIPEPASGRRLDQGPFGIEQDEGWRTLVYTTPSENPIRNPGLGLAGYIWEENGPSVAVREGRETLEDHVERMASLPFVDVLYIRCDWKHVQSQPGRLDLAPFWKLTLEAAQKHNLRFAFRVQLSNPEFQPDKLAMPDFLIPRVPLVKIGKIPRRPGAQYVEPRYDHPEFRKAFSELNRLLAERFDGNPLLEWVDLMQYGFWGEGHTSNFPNPFPDPATAERTFVDMTSEQLAAWKKTPLAVNTQPDISRVGNRAVIDMAKNAGAWLRSDSIIVEEPIQIDELGNRPPWLAAILEDGTHRRHDLSKITIDAAGIDSVENYMLHILDIGANYWGLWTESANLALYNERFPHSFERLRSAIGYRIRPSWVWQRKRSGGFELIAGIANRGVAGIPGILWLSLEAADRSWKISGRLDAGHPNAGKVRMAAFAIPSGYTGPVDLSAELEVRPNTLRKVAWACEQPLNDDGSFRIALAPVDAPGWRKGV